jgi:Mn2+/Fe2+ NRAMP family transporter
MTTTIKKPIDSSAGDAATHSNDTGGFKRLLRSLGPGLITGASDDDPSGIGTRLQTLDRTTSQLERRLR